MRRREDGGRRSGLGGEALRRGDFGEAAAERPDHAPSAHIGSQRDGHAARHDHPELGPRAGRLDAGRDERERDDAHGLLRVVGAVRKRDQARGDGLPVPEPFRDLRVAHAPHDAEDQLHRKPRRQTGDQGRYERRNEDLLDDDEEVDALDAGAHGDRADQAAHKGMGR